MSKFLDNADSAVTDNRANMFVKVNLNRKDILLLVVST